MTMPLMQMNCLEPEIQEVMPRPPQQLVQPVLGTIHILHKCQKMSKRSKKVLKSPKTIRPALTQSKWNMDEVFSSKFYLSYVDCRYATNLFLEIPPCTHHVIFINEFVLSIKTPPKAITYCD